MHNINVETSLQIIDTEIYKLRCLIDENLPITAQSKEDELQEKLTKLYQDFLNLKQAIRDY